MLMFVESVGATNEPFATVANGLALGLRAAQFGKRLGIFWPLPVAGRADLKRVTRDLPVSDQDPQNPWVVCVDFSNESVWEEIKALISAPQTDPLSGIDFYANVRFVRDQRFANQGTLQIVHALPDDYPGFVVFVVDAKTISDREHPLLIIGFAPTGDDPEGGNRPPSRVTADQLRTFRAIPSTIQSIENNLSLANMDFEDFAKSVDKDGVFRGFPN